LVAITSVTTKGEFEEEFVTVVVAVVVEGVPPPTPPKATAAPKPDRISATARTATVRPPTRVDFEFSISKL
jgi:hypothetical protein